MKLGPLPLVYGWKRSNIAEEAEKEWKIVRYFERKAHTVVLL